MQKYKCALFLVLLGVAPVAAENVKVNPIEKIVQLLTELRAKVIADGEKEEKAFKEYFEWCDDASKEKHFEVQTLSTQKEELTATIAKESSDIEAQSATIEELAAKIATNEADLKAATEIRAKERKDFEAVEAELMDGVDALGRAIKILEKHAALIQGKEMDATMQDMAQGFGAILDAAGVNLHDKAKLQSLLQANADGAAESATEVKDEYAALGAPAPATYKGHSKGIVEVLEDMLDKAEEDLSQARKEEMNAQHNFNMLKQSLEDEMKFDGEEMADTKKAKATSEETKATAEGDLEVTTKDLADAQTTLKDVGMECMTQAQTTEVSKKSRDEEIEALNQAIKIITSMTQGATERTYGFIQIESAYASEVGSRLHTHDDLVGMEAVNVVRKLAGSQHSSVLAQLASRMEAAIRVGSGTADDPFAKVKGLIKEMIERLLKEAAAEASHKEWCDEEFAESREKKAKLTSTVDDLTTKIDKATATIGTLSAEVKVLQAELAKLAKLQAEMDAMRAEEHEAFKLAEADLAQGVEGIRQALKVLRDYYAAKEDSGAFVQEDLGAQMQQPAPPQAHGKASGAATGIIGMLEVAEADFSRNLVETRSAEEEAQDAYEKTTQENKITKTMKEQDVKYKNKEVVSLQKFVQEATSDRDGSQTELDAVTEYIEKLKEQCIAKPEPYAERKKRREAEIAGLKEALSILEGEAVFLQTGAHHRSSFRGVKTHHA